MQSLASPLSRERGGSPQLELQPEEASALAPSIPPQSAPPRIFVPIPCRGRKQRAG